MKSALKKLGFRAQRIPPGIVDGIDLFRDLKLILAAHPTIIDVGAHDGQFVDSILSIFSKVSLHAFEPAPEPFNRLAHRHRDTPSVNLHHLGLSSSEGTDRFHIYENQALNSFLPLSSEGLQQFSVKQVERTVSVKKTTLDLFSAIQGIGYIDLLKIDTQGYDLEILRGASELLAAYKIKTVLIEINFGNLYAGQAKAHEVFAMLEKHNFQLVDLYEKCRIHPFLGWCTALFALRQDSPKTSL